MPLCASHICQVQQPQQQLRQFATFSARRGAQIKTCRSHEYKRGLAVVVASEPETGAWFVADRVRPRQRPPAVCLRADIYRIQLRSTLKYSFVHAITLLEICGKFSTSFLPSHYVLYSALFVKLQQRKV